MSAMSKLVQGAQILLLKPNPTLSFFGRPKITGQAAGEALASIVDPYKFLPAVMAAIHRSPSHSGVTKKRIVAWPEG